MKQTFKIFLIGFSLLLVSLIVWMSLYWAHAGRHLKAAEKNYLDLQAMENVEHDKIKVDIILSIQGWSSSNSKLCSVFKKTASPSIYVARQFANSRSHVKRAFLICRLEYEFSKEALENYFLKYAYGGYGKYGVEETSQHLFGKPFGSLSNNELIILALKFKRPSEDTNSDYFKTYSKMWIKRLGTLQ